MRVAANPKMKSGSAPTGKTKSVPEARPKEKPDPVKPPDGGANTKKQAVADAAVVADRERITQLSKEGKIQEAQSILQPYVDAAKAARTSAEKKSAMDAIIGRLDVTSEKQKSFWSGNKELAKKLAAKRGNVILELTPGGKVIDGWKDLENAFTWDSKDMPPHGWNLWGTVSANYSRDAVGEVDVLQAIEKFPRGGPTWRGDEWPTIVDEGRVTHLNIFGMDEAGNILDAMRVQPASEVAKELFKGK